MPGMLAAEHGSAGDGAAKRRIVIRGHSCSLVNRYKLFKVFEHDLVVHTAVLLLTVTTNTFSLSTMASTANPKGD